MRIQKAIACLLLSSTLAGCVGQNYVQTFEPVIDKGRMGASEAQYQHDLGECRSYAVKEDPTNKAARQALAGALVGAALGAAIGGGRYGGRLAARGAVAGAFAGGANGAISGMSAQQTIVSRCMFGRGYPVIYAGDLAQ